jgi:hypothetical protein
MSVMTARFEMAMVFPVEGESYVELCFDGENWADLQLDGVDLGGTGTQRTANARVMIDLYRPWRSGRETAWRFEFNDAAAQLERAARRKWWWGFGVAEALVELRRARDRLIENEHRRDPLTDTEGLTPAGQAFSKMSRREQAEFLSNLGPDKTSADESIEGTVR